jgi:CBS domain-containing protein
MTSTLPIQSTLSTTSTNLSTSPSSKYRFSAVDDLQLPPALSVTTETPLEDALTMALEREYSQLTVISPERRKLLGYLDIPHVVEQLKSGKRPRRGDGELLVKDMFTRFDRRKSVGYQVITPDTSLDVLDEFLKNNNFAIGITLGGMCS